MYVIMILIKMSFQLGRNITDYFSRVNSGEPSVSFSDLSSFMRPPPTLSGDMAKVFSSDSDFRAPWEVPGSIDYFSQTNDVSSTETPDLDTPSISKVDEFSDSTSLTTNFAAFGLSQGIKEVNDYENSQNLKDAQLGIGVGGHSFDAVNNAEQQNNYNSLTHGIESTAISLGSAFGPEGLAVGAGVAAAVGLAAPSFAPSTSITPTNSGTMVDASTL